MCILCIASRLSRRILAVLPWLVIPLILFWALSQLLPPGVRFEVTSPRLACVFVLLFSLLWYEILMPRLSAWRERRNALLRERQRIALLEAAKWRKEATRRCRNCMTPYKDQNPPSGRFMCTCCGHVSRRPVLDISNVAIPGNCEAFSSSGISLSDSNLRNFVAGLPSDLQGKPIKVWDGKTWKVLDGQFWPSDRPIGFSLGKPLPPSRCWGSNSGERCTAERSYSSVVDILLRILGSIFICSNWVYKKLFRVVSSPEDGGSNSTPKISTKKGEEGSSSQSSKGEKARRKAEEKRQARLEKEMLEEEERKQREEVARLIEERRRQRDEKQEAEKASERHTVPEKGSERDKTLHRENRKEKETERKRHDKVKEKNTNEEKIHSPTEDTKKKTEKKETQKTSSRHPAETLKSSDKIRSHGETAVKCFEHGSKGTINGTWRVNASEHQHVDNMKASKFCLPQSNRPNTFSGKNLRTNLSLGARSPKVSTPASESPKQGTYSAWNSIPWANVWGKSKNTPAKDTCSASNVEKSMKGSNVDFPTASLSVSSNAAPYSHVRAEQQQLASQAKWQQLANGTSNSPPLLKSPCSDNPFDAKLVDAGGNDSPKAEVQPLLISNPFSIGISTDTPLGSAILSNSIVVSVSNRESPAAGLIQSSNTTGHADSAFGKTDYEDSASVPDPVSLLGPVSEALDNFPSELEIRHSSGNQRTCNPSSTCNPISPPSNRARSPECPVSELLPSELIDIQSATNSSTRMVVKDSLSQVPSITEPWGLPSLTLNGADCAPEHSKWQMWNAPEYKENEIPAQENKWLNQQPFGHMMGGWHGQDSHPNNTKFLDGVGADLDMRVNQLKVAETDPYDQSPNNLWFKSQQRSGRQKKNMCMETNEASMWESSKPLTKLSSGGIYTDPDVQSLWSYK